MRKKVLSTEVAAAAAVLLVVLLAESASFMVDSTKDFNSEPASALTALTRQLVMQSQT